MRKFDYATQEEKERLLDIFVNSVYHYEDRLLIIFNKTDGEKIIYFDELKKKGVKPIKGKGCSNMKPCSPPIKRRFLLEEGMFALFEGGRVSRDH